MIRAVKTIVWGRKNKKAAPSSSADLEASSSSDASRSEDDDDDAHAARATYLTALLPSARSAALDGCALPAALDARGLERLRSIALVGCDGVSDRMHLLRDLPALSRMAFRRCANLDKIMVWGAIRRVSADDCAALVTFHGQMEGLEDVGVSECPRLAAMPASPNLSRVACVNGAPHVDVPPRARRLRAKNASVDFGAQPSGRLRSVALEDCVVAARDALVVPRAESIRLARVRGLARVDGLGAATRVLEAVACPDLRALAAAEPARRLRVVRVEGDAAADAVAIAMGGERVMDEMKLWSCARPMAFEPHFVGVRSLHVDGVAGLARVPPIAWLEDLRLANCPNVRSVRANANAGVRIQGCAALESVDAEGARVRVEGCDHLRRVGPKAPETLELVDCPAIREASAAASMWVTRCAALATIQGGAVVEATACDAARVVSAGKRAKLTRCNLRGTKSVLAPSVSIDACENAAHVGLDDAVGELAVVACAQLPSALPASLVSLTIERCEVPTEIRAAMPRGLEALVVRDCASFERVPMDMPTSMRRVDLRACPRLTDTSGFRSLGTRVVITVQK
jgi:hypothetical protein